MISYGIENWGNDNFVIENGEVCLNTPARPSLIKITQKVRKKDVNGPLLLRFPHLIEKQIKTLYETVKKAGKEYQYSGGFRAVFPLKVNQYPGFLAELKDIAKRYSYGLEAGSKAELILAMAYNKLGSPIIVNGFKDKDLISLAFLAKRCGHDITITIEGVGELKKIIEVAKDFGREAIPKIGIRIRLHTSGVGIWAKSGGMDSKFGLTSTEVVEALKKLKKAKLIDYFTMIHFHIGSQLYDIAPLKRAIREAGNIYAELIKMGATNLCAIDLGGGLAVEYSTAQKTKTYTLEEVANDVCYLLKTISANKGVKEPDVYSESGRFIAASHACLVAPVLELFSGEYTEKVLNLKKKGKNPPLVEELKELYDTITAKNAAEYLHDSLDHMESLLTLFDLGYIDLQDRSNTEVLVNLIIKKALKIDKDLTERAAISERIQERYLVNFSLFQSLPDYWGLGQEFPIMPLKYLDKKPTRSASLWDITCDSDGEVRYSAQNPLYLHDIDVTKENYFLGFFLVGAYQEVLGMQHNLFSRPSEATILITPSGFKIKSITKSDSLTEILEDFDYSSGEIIAQIKSLLANDALSARLDEIVARNGYLKSIF